MSCQRGNIARVRKQKHQNVTTFKNTLHDSSKKTKAINEKEIAEVCKRCQDIITWKVKYKKYKPLSQPKTCTRCHKKTIKDAYYIVCLPCAQSLEVCCKCGKKEEIVSHFSPSKTEQLQALAQLEQEVKALSERKRRAYYRYVDKLQGKKKKKKKPAEGAEDSTVLSDGGEEEAEEEAAAAEDYLKSAREKLEKLKKGIDDDFLDDLDDLDLSDDDDDEWEDEDDDS